jgi:hypothetical protein
MDASDPPIDIRLTTDSSGLVHASGRSTFVVFPRQSLERVATAYRDAVRKVLAVLTTRWNSIQATNIPFDDLTDLAQRITLHELYVRNANGRFLELRVDGRRHNALRSSGAFDDVRWVVSRTIPAGWDGHDELGAALLGISVPDYRGWLRNQERHANR